jgi:hypothetical protein
MGDPMDYTLWAIDQVKSLRPEATSRSWPSIRDLTTTLATLRGPEKVGQIFGLEASNFAADGRSQIAEAIVSALLAWRGTFDENDVVSLLDLDKIGVRFDIAGMRLSKRFPLRCDPLGTREGLSQVWLDRLAHLDDAMAGRRAIALDAIKYVGQSERPHETKFGAPDESSLYEHALRHEVAERKTFPREVAAFWSTANGIIVDDDPILRPIREWTLEDRGWCIGCGSYMQGSLTVAVTKKKGLLEAKVVDRDDDGVVLAKYDDLGAFLDALLEGNATKLKRAAPNKPE